MAELIGGVAYGVKSPKGDSNLTSAERQARARKRKQAEHQRCRAALWQITKAETAKEMREIAVNALTDGGWDGMEKVEAQYG